MIETWEVLKQELKDQFPPCNMARIARDAPKMLRAWQTGLARDSVNEYTSFILDIKDMSEVDRLFNFSSNCIHGLG